MACVWCRVCFERWCTSVPSRGSSVTSASCEPQPESQPQSSPSPPSSPTLLRTSPSPTPKSSRWVRDCLVPVFWFLSCNWAAGLYFVELERCFRVNVELWHDLEFSQSVMDPVVLSDLQWFLFIYRYRMGDDISYRRLYSTLSYLVFIFTLQSLFAYPVSTSKWKIF